MALFPKPITAAVFTRPTGPLSRESPVYDVGHAEAWRQWRRVGELHYATSFKARQVARVDWKIKENGVLLDDDDTANVLDLVTMPHGVAETVEALAINLEVTGKVHYLLTLDSGWQVAATTRPKLAELIEKAVLNIVGVTQDPEDPQKSISPVLANMDTIRELALLQALQRSQSRLRIAQRGILFQPAEAEFEGDTDFESSFEEATKAPIANEYAPEAVSPFIVKYPEALIDKWRHLILESPYDEQLPEKIEAVTRRLALGLDLPPEALLGIGRANHWSVWSMKESTYRAHVEPLAKKVAPILTRAITETAPDRGKIEVIPDPGRMLAPLVSIVDLIEMYNLGLVDGSYVRKVADIPEEHAPPAPPLEQRAPNLRRLSADRGAEGPTDAPTAPSEARFTGNM